MKVPMWLLRLLMSYLEQRNMILRFRGCSSNPKDKPGVMPQGTLNGVNTDKTCLFIVNFTLKDQFLTLLDIRGCDSLMDKVLETKLLGCSKSKTT